MNTIRLTCCQTLHPSGAGCAPKAHTHVPCKTAHLNYAFSAHAECAGDFGCKLSNIASGVRAHNSLDELFDFLPESGSGIYAVDALLCCVKVEGNAGALCFFSTHPNLWIVAPLACASRGWHRGKFGPLKGIMVTQTHTHTRISRVAFKIEM